MDFFYVFFYSFVAGLSTVAGVYLVKRFTNWTTNNSYKLLSFAVGVLIANSFLHLLPESQELNPDFAMISVVGGLMLLFLIEHFISIHACDQEQCDVHSVSYTGTIGIGIHSLIDGVIIGVGFEVSFAIGVLTALAVVMHELPEGIFTYTLLIHDHVSEKTALLYSWLVALATPFGAMVAFFLLKQAEENVLGVLLGLAAGSFLYVGASDLIPQAHRKPDVLNITLVFAGILFVVLVGQLLPK